MFHNNGGFVPNDLTVSRGTTINKARMDTLEMSHHLEALAQNVQNLTSGNVSQFNMQNFPHPLHMNPQMHPLSHYSLHSNSKVNFPSFNLDFRQNVMPSLNLHAQNKTNSYSNELLAQSILNLHKYAERKESAVMQARIDKPIQSFHKLTERPTTVVENIPNKLVTEKMVDSKTIRNERLQLTVRHIEDIINSDIANRKKNLELSKEQKLKDTPIKELDNESIPKKLNDEETKPKLEKDCMFTMEFDGQAQNVIDNPFEKDLSQISKDNLGENDILNGQKGVTEAWSVIKNGNKRKIYYQCDLCQIVFSHPKRYLIHVKWHNFGLTNLKREELAQVREMKNALKRVEEEHAYTCQECGLSLKSLSALKNHKTKHHKDDRKECKVCKVVVGDWKDLREHNINHHASAEGFRCQHCNKLFKHMHTLIKHSMQHFEKTHACPECPKLFGSEQLLKQHIKTHERSLKERSFHCSFCGKGCIDAFSLQIHERYHTNEKPFVCDICSASFTSKSGLTRHTKVSHDASKPFECKICHRSFTTELIRDRHEIRNHSDLSQFKYECPICKKKYMTSRDLRKHKSKNHPKRKMAEIEDSN